MKIFRFIAVLILPLIVLFSTLNPAFAKVKVAENQSLKDSTSFCDRLSDIHQKITSKVNDDSISTKVDEYINSLEQENTSIATRLSQSRAEADSSRQKRYESLFAQDISESQKQALLDRKELIEQLIKLRRQKVDNSLSNFDSRLADLLNNYKNDLGLQKDRMLSSIDSAFNNASEQCSKGEDERSIKANYKNKLESSKSEFVKNSAKNYKSRFQQIRNERNTSIKTANEEFKKAVEKFKQN